IPDLTPHERLIPTRIGSDAANHQIAIFDSAFKLRAEILIRIEVTSIAPGPEAHGKQVAIEPLRVLVTVLPCIGNKDVVSHLGTGHTRNQILRSSKCHLNASN